MPRRFRNPENGIELIGRRTSHSKSFDVGDNKIKLVCSARTPFHYRDERGRFQDIDTDVQIDPSSGTLFAGSLPFRFAVLREGVGFEYTSRRDGKRFRVTLVRAGDRVLPPELLAPRHEANRIIFQDVVPGLDIEFVVNAGGVKTLRTIKNADAPHKLYWIVEGADDRVSQELTCRDAKYRKVKGTLAIDGEMWVETIEQSVRVRDRSTRIPRWTNEVAYPIVVDPTITEEVAVTGDDVSFYSLGSDYIRTSTCEFGVTDTTTYAGIRFQTVALANAITISSATLRVNVTGNGGQSDYIAGTVYGADVDDLAQWTVTTPNPRDVTRTTANAAFTKPTANGTKNTTVTSIVQEIVDRAGWASGNDMGFVIIPGAGSYVLTQLEDFGAAGTAEPELEVTYSGGFTEMVGSLAAVSSVTSGNMDKQPAIVGTVPAASTVNGSAAVDYKLVASAAAVSTAAALIGVLVDIVSVAINAVSTAAAAAMTNQLNISGTVVAGSTAAAALGWDPALVGTVTGLSVVADVPLIRDVDMLGSLNALSGASADILKNEVQIAGTVNGVSSAASNMVADRRMEGTSPGVSSAVALMTGDWRLIGTIAAQAQADAKLDRQQALAGSSPGASLVVGFAVVDWSLVGSVAGLSVVVSSMSATFVVTGSVAAVSVVTSGQLDRQQGLQGSSPGTSIATAAASADKTLSGSVPALSTFNAVLSADKEIVGNVNASSSIAGFLGTTRGIAGTIAAGASVAAQFDNAGRFVGTSSGVSGVVAQAFVDRRIAGSVAAVGGATAAAAVDRPLSGSSAGQSGVVGSLERFVAIVGTSQATSGCVAVLVGVWSLKGVVNATSIVVGNAVVDWSLRGSVETRAVVEAELSTVILQGPYAPAELEGFVPGLILFELFIPSDPS